VAADDGRGDVGEEGRGDRQAREVAVGEHVHGERGVDLDAADAPLAEAEVDVLHRRDQARPCGVGME
jgi:hypothetical protein